MVIEATRTRREENPSQFLEWCWSVGTYVYSLLWLNGGNNFKPLLIQCGDEDQSILGLNGGRVGGTASGGNESPE